MTSNAVYFYSIGLSQSNGTGSQNFDVRLVNGPDQSSGILQIYFNGVWGTVCQEGFTNIAACVVCRQLGFEGGRTLLFTNFDFATGVVWLDNVNCSGTEENLNQCGHAPWGVHNCFPVHMLDVNIQCNGEPSHVIWFPWQLLIAMQLDCIMPYILMHPPYTHTHTHSTLQSLINS